MDDLGVPNDELAARHEIEPSSIEVRIRRARELKATKLHKMESWVPDLRYAQDKRELQNVIDKSNRWPEFRLLALRNLPLWGTALCSA